MVKNFRVVNDDDDNIVAAVVYTVVGIFAAVAAFISVQYSDHSPSRLTIYTSHLYPSTDEPPQRRLRLLLPPRQLEHGQAEAEEDEQEQEQGGTQQVSGFVEGKRGQPGLGRREGEEEGGKEGQLESYVRRHWREGKVRKFVEQEKIVSVKFHFFGFSQKPESE